MLALLCVQDYAHGFNLQPDPLGARARRRAARRRGGAIQSLWPISPWPRRSSSARNSRASATRRSGPSRSTPWTATHRFPRRAADLCRRLGARARAGGARQAAQSQPSRLVLVSPTSTTRTARATTAARSTPRSRSICRATGLRTPALAAAYGQLGEREAAGRAVRDLLGLRPDFAATRASEVAKWWEPELRRAHDRRPAQGGAGRAPRRRRPVPGRAKPPRRGRDRGAAVLRHEPGEGPGLPLRGHGRGDHERARPHRGHPRRVPDLGVPGAAGRRRSRPRSPGPSP